MNNIILIIGVLFFIGLIYWWFFKIELLDATVSTNPFSDLRCIDDSLPIIRILDNKTFQCLSKDNSNCMLKSDFKIPETVKCGDVNTTLVKEIRNRNSPITKIYSDLDQNVNYSLLTCNPQGLNNEDHWCGQLWSNIKDRCNKPEGKYGFLSSPCKQIPAFLTNLSKTSESLDNIDIVSRDEILQAKAIAKAKVDAARSRVKR